MMEEVLLTSICRPKQWKTIASTDLHENGYPVYGANGKIGFYDTYTHEHPTVLITCRGATCGTINICEPKSYVNGNAMALDNLSSDVDLYYLKHYLEFRKLDDVISGSAQPQITGQGLSKVKIPLPPLPKQQKIANILDAADALRQNDKALIAKYDELTQALFLDMFGDPVSNPKGWEFKVLNQLVSKLGDGLHGTPKYSEDGEYYFVNGNNLDNGKITISENTKRVDFSEYEKHKKDLNENTMLVSINGTIGKIAFYNNEKIILGKSACYFNLIKGSVNDIFLFHIFKSDYFLRYSSSLSTGSTIQNVSLKTMREFPIPIPPLELQNQFAERVAVIEEQKAIAQKQLEKSEELFNSLLQKAFKGELV